MIESPVLTKVRIDFGKFQVYDVEPLSIPDLFAERPVMVFGKWHGRLTGEIVLHGGTSSGSYVNRIDIGREKPIRSNSALQYLWARHRIAFLSDYNHLRNDPERVKEVTQLGLVYNLLTAYTSFVAIDTEARLVDGQAVTIKQPLPLPEGVSDYAVGRGMVAQKAAAPHALYSLSMADRSSVKEEEFKSKPVHASVEIKEISAIGGLPKETIQKVIQQQIPSLKLYYQNALNKKHDLKGQLIFQLSVDSNGKVTKVTLVSSKLNDKELEKSFIQKIKELNFPKPEGKGNVSSTVSFNLRTS
jgi:Ca-activated chloride channel family protein